MNCLENKSFVRIEVLPIIKENIEGYLDSEHFEDWIESEYDIEDFENSELDETVINDIKESVIRVVNDCANDYEFEEINCNSLEVLQRLIDIIQDEWYMERSNKAEELRQLLERQDYEVQYYGDEY